MNGASTMPGRVAFIKTSLIDFPGRLASVLFLPLCDFRCPYCHNAALVDPGAAEGDDSLVPMGEFLEFLDRRKSLISGVVISGGEPLVHEETPRIARAVRERGLAVKLDTNGSFPSRIGPVAADYVALDFKTSSPAYGRVAPALPEAGARVLESLAYLRSSGTPFEIRITCAPGVVGPGELEAMSLSLERGDEVLLQAFRPGGCLDPAWDAVEPYSRGEMEALLAIARSRAPRARLRGA
jgi:pyruvate formate lyase activating enzyme